MQTPHLAGGQVSARGIIRIGDQHDARALVDMRQDRIDVIVKVVIVCGNRRRARQLRVDRKLHVGVFAVNQFFARPGESIDDTLQQFIRARTKSHARRVELVALGKRFGEGLGIDFRVKMATRDRLLGGRERGRAHAQRRFVGRQL